MNTEIRLYDLENTSIEDANALLIEESFPALLTYGHSHATLYSVGSVISDSDVGAFLDNFLSKFGFKLATVL